MTTPLPTTEVFEQFTTKAVEGLGILGDANQKVLRQLVDLSTATASEGVRVLSLRGEVDFLREIRGTAELTDDPAAELIEELAQKYTGRPFGDRPGEQRVIVRVRPDHVVLYD